MNKTNYFSANRCEEILKQTPNLILDQITSSITIGLIGTFSLLAMLIDPESKLGKGASKLLEALFSSMSLLPILLLIAISLLLLSAIIRAMEISQNQLDSRISYVVAQNGIKGFSSFMIPIAFLSFSIGAVMLPLYIYMSKEKLDSLGIHPETGFLLFFFVPFAILFFITVFSFFNSMITSINSKALSLICILIFFWLWIIAVINFIK